MATETHEAHEAQDIIPTNRWAYYQPRAVRALQWDGTPNTLMRLVSLDTEWTFDSALKEGAVTKLVVHASNGKIDVEIGDWVVKVGHKVYVSANNAFRNEMAFPGRLSDAPADVDAPPWDRVEWPPAPVVLGQGEYKRSYTPPASGGFWPAAIMILIAVAVVVLEVIVGQYPALTVVSACFVTLAVVTVARYIWLTWWGK